MKDFPSILHALATWKVLGRTLPKELSESAFAEALIDASLHAHSAGPRPAVRGRFAFGSGITYVVDSGAGDPAYFRIPRDWYLVGELRFEAAADLSLYLQAVDLYAGQFAEGPARAGIGVRLRETRRLLEAGAFAEAQACAQPILALLRILETEADATSGARARTGGDRGRDAQRRAKADREDLARKLLGMHDQLSRRACSLPGKVRLRILQKHLTEWRKNGKPVGRSTVYRFLALARSLPKT